MLIISTCQFCGRECWPRQKEKNELIVAGQHNSCPGSGKPLKFICSKCGFTFLPKDFNDFYKCLYCRALGRDAVVILHNTGLYDSSAQ